MKEGEEKAQSGAHTNSCRPHSSRKRGAAVSSTQKNGERAAAKVPREMEEGEAPFLSLTTAIRKAFIFLIASFAFPPTATVGLLATKKNEVTQSRLKKFFLAKWWEDGTCGGANCCGVRCPGRDQQREVN